MSLKTIFYPVNFWSMNSYYCTIDYSDDILSLYIVNFLKMLKQYSQPL